MIRVLVVDQDTMLLEEIVRALRDHCDVDAVTNKGDCLDLLRQNEFEVIVACERLADGSGLELLGQIAKRWPATLRVFAADQERLRLLQGRLGPFELFQTLVYPIDTDKLLHTLSLATAAQNADADTTNIQHVVMGGEEEEPVAPPPSVPVRTAPVATARVVRATPSIPAALQKVRAASAAKRKPVDLRAPARPAALPPASFKIEPSVEEPTNKAAVAIGAVVVLVLGATALAVKFMGTPSAPPAQVVRAASPPQPSDTVATPVRIEPKRRGPSAAMAATTSPTSMSPSKSKSRLTPAASTSVPAASTSVPAAAFPPVTTAAPAASTHTPDSTPKDPPIAPEATHSQQLRQSAPIDPPLVGTAARQTQSTTPVTEASTSFTGRTLEQTDPPTPTPDLSSGGKGTSPRRALAPPPGTQEAQLIHRVAPEYPVAAARQRIEGFVDLQFLITKEGTVENITIANASPADIFDRAAIAALSTWRYSPRVVEGQPVASPEQVRLQFKLDANTN